MLSKQGMKTTLTFAILISGLLLVPTFAGAQTRAPAPSQLDPSMTRERPLSEMEEEMRAKQAIKFAEKEHQENVDRAKEIGSIGRQIKAAAKNTPLLSHDSEKKIERLEKLTKKIRGEAGGDDQEVELKNQPADLPAAMSRMGEAAETLSKEVQNTPRQVVSASVIENANVLLELIKLVRTLSAKR
jgi:seryl-tRNA synthetase